MNARMKDALDETMLLSDKWAPNFPCSKVMLRYLIQNHTKPRRGNRCTYWSPVQGLRSGKSCSRPRNLFAILSRSPLSICFGLSHMHRSVSVIL
jgi:hypothetical protein